MSASNMSTMHTVYHEDTSINEMMVVTFQFWGHKNKSFGDKKNPILYTSSRLHPQYILLGPPYKKKYIFFCNINNNNNNNNHD